MKKEQPTPPLTIRSNPAVCMRHSEAKEQIMALWISILNRSNSWLMKRALLYFQGTFALTHRYSTAADQTEEKQKNPKQEENNYLLFSNLHLQASSILFTGPNGSSSLVTHFPCFTWGQRITPDLSLATFIFRAAPNASDSHTSPFRAFHCVQWGELSPRKGKTRGFCPTAVPWHRTCSPVLPALSCSAEVAQAVPHFGQCSFQTLLHSSSHFWLIVQLKVIWHPQFVLYWLNIHRQTIQYQFKAKSIKTRCCWQMQISPCRTEPCCIISVTEALSLLQ